MAQRRMFSKTIIDSDAFLDMPLSTQSLYFHLSMRADDEGFVNNPKKIMRMIGSNDDELKLLIAKKFIIHFESGIIVIRHWRIHNSIQKDRRKDTIHTQERMTIALKENNVYTLDTNCIHSVLVGKERKGEVRLGEGRGNVSTDFKNYMDVLEFLKSQGDKNKSIEVKFETMTVGVSTHGKAYNKKTMLDLDRQTETRFLTYLQNNTKEIN